MNRESRRSSPRKLAVLVAAVATCAACAACSDRPKAAANRTIELPDSVSDLLVDSTLTSPAVRGRRVAIPPSFAAALARYSADFVVLGRRDLDHDTRDYIAHDDTLQRVPVFG